MERCIVEAQRKGVAYPRTCPTCGLGPCRFETPTAMTNPPTDEMVEAAARAIFVASKPKNMIPADWDSGALLGGRDNSYRHAILNQARGALEAALFYQGEVVKSRCPYCDDTGDVHSIDGEWRGECDCRSVRVVKVSEIEHLRDVWKDDAPTYYVDALTALISKAEKV